MIKHATCCFYCSPFQQYTNRTMTFTMLKFPFTTVYITYYLQSLHCLPFSVDKSKLKFRCYTNVNHLYGFDLKLTSIF